jgi:hypothetical protein
MTVLAPDWLSPFTARWTEALRTPLVPVESAPGQWRLVPTKGPLAVYQRQYWYRLLGVMQGEYPLTAKLAGLWRFNHAAMGYLVENPPPLADPALQRVARGFDAAVPVLFARPAPGLAPLTPHSLEQLAAAAQLDALWQQVFMAPPEQPWVPSADEAASLATSQLHRAAHVAWFNDRLGLMPLRTGTPVAAPVSSNAPATHIGEAGLSTPATIAATSPPERQYAVFRVDPPNCHGLSSVAVAGLAPAQATLYRALDETPVAAAVATLAARHPEATPRDVQNWLSFGMGHHFWRGATAAESRTGPA